MIINLTNFSIVKFSGSKVADFLQGQLTCDVMKLSPTEAILGAYCNYKGRVLAIFRLFKYQDDYYFILPTDIATETIVALNKYAVFSKTQIEDVSNSFKIQGAQQQDLSLENEETLLHLPDDKSRLLLLNSHRSAPNTNAWTQHDIELGIPSIHKQTIGLFTPHMLNLPTLGAVSFTKGCYTGQEIIARTEHLGKSKKTLQKKQVKTKVSPGDKLENGGIVVDATSTREEAYSILFIS